ncbi:MULTISPECIES: phage holin [Clostridium]|uniref:Holin, phage phi LC3 family n=1 Tax=Clostridium intestinale DSM 6191 TaxID=1121320 RepID=A0A1M5WS21_9CLOT|nr:MULTISPECIES: phage holin [Clostridium]SHH90258.1 holin, phage phi LC3 family [Clostridium intestinale DSM 6191]
MNDSSRFKNYALWISVFSLIPLILEAFGLNIIPKNYNEIVTAVLSVLVMAGIINNPSTESKWYLDDEKKNENSVEEK